MGGGLFLKHEEPALGLQLIQLCQKEDNRNREHRKKEQKSIYIETVAPKSSYSTP